jgi:steroid 5-alpha reductase family enzyme
LIELTEYFTIYFMKKLILFIAAVAALFLGITYAVFGSGFISALTEASPLITILIVTGSQGIVSFIFGAVTKDYSWVDRMWSTAPVFYAWVYAFRGGLEPPLVIAAGLVTLWGVRLTYNFARKGGYSGVEDYRWPVLQEKIKNPFMWQLFNFGFICVFQISLFMLFTLPLYRIFLHAGSAPSVGFYIAAFFYLAFLVYETAADQQQWNFHLIKKALKEGKISGPDGLSEREAEYLRDARDGFVQSGLFSRSRHPNYFGELAIWWTFYVMGSLYAGSFIHWSLIGPVLLTAIFFGSTRFTEAISASKYPAYTEFQKTTSAVIPWFSKKRHIDEAVAAEAAESAD